MMCAACIPWTKDFQFDESPFRHQVKNLIDNDIKSIYIMGTSGEGYALDEKTFIQVVTVFLDECSKGQRVMPMTGIISTSMREMSNRIAMARDLGCRDFQLALPCWGALSDSEVFTFFKTVCRTFQDCRFINYNNGPRSKTKVTVDQFLRLEKEIPNLAGVKYSSSDIYEIYSIATAETSLAFYLVDNGYTYGAMNGEVGFLNSFASVNFNLSWKYFEAGQKKDFKTLNLLSNYFFELNKSFSCVEGDLMDSAFDKTIERVADDSFNNTVYPPYECVKETEFQQIRESMQKTVKKYLALG